MGCKAAHKLVTASWGSRMARALLLGYFGAKNFGDEWMLASFLKGSSAMGVTTDNFTVISRDPAQTMREHGVEAVPRRWKSILSVLSDCNVVIGCGGSLLQDATSFRSLVFYSLLVWTAKGMGKKVALIGQGLGPLSRAISQRFARITLNLCDLVTFRDPISLTQAQRSGACIDRCHLTADLTFTWDLGTRIGERESTSFLMAVNLRPMPKRHGDLSPVLAEVLQTFVMSKKGRILLLPLQEDVDEEPLQAVAERLSAPTQWWRGKNWSSMLDGLNSSNFLLAMRLHALIAACLLSVPFVGLSYDPKVDRIFGKDFADQILPLKVTTKELLTAMISTKEAWGEALQSRVQTFVSEQRKEAWRNFELLRPLLEG